ncbi:hypothetical protein AJ85_14190 [Alkalihalobacillus alcalophilus ATCC 27647 = CGMCC 1.3604]|uniref:Uncharacterized protein n=1 Tax=Alkalihalobacillus alcalophilus ATCC 27647 = CGMCC 1.3604 TaxID=1218173 RepID=A0A094WG75_ALKAL|nr:DNA sulfur modification protein DndB [Alkalihalobacillus alcalophilus]KGA96734.1 hypothetical protein BALCAV_0214325 [Alkalihalobacillus alcalophilus ATCC 27647 = CGMCC 1.3604]MED1563803.1 DNA sulfur modification protein DndB [Alkalihalobacillus alcalophilus]THG92226.1 hypothetical protein AJ85_14190 [Alkalihalobacillus alcalophilus ATCC 27647 = CGMCC 1.3604]
MQNGLSIKQSIEVMPIRELLELMDKEQLHSRNINQNRVRLFKTYIEENLEHQLFIPPLVLNKTSMDSLFNDSVYELIDGNVRLKAFQQLNQKVALLSQSENENDIQLSERLGEFLQTGIISVQIFENLEKEVVHQLYIDFNTKGKKVVLNKLIEYDKRDDLNNITNILLSKDEGLQRAGIETEKRALIKPTNKNFLSLSQLRKIIAIFVTNEPSFERQKSFKLDDPYLTSDDYVELVSSWFHLLFEVENPETIGNYEHTIFSSFPLLQALAYYSTKDTESMNFEQKLSVIQERMEIIHQIDFSIQNPLWESFDHRKGTRGGYTILYNSLKNILKINNWLERLSRKEVGAM